MATDETGFKVEIRKALKALYGDRIHMWTNTDAYRHGLPDFSVSYDGKFYACEAKFVATPPKRDTSKALKHEATTEQITFLNNTIKTGNYGGLLIGFKDVAVLFPDNFKSNYTMEELKAVEPAYRFEKIRGHWDVSRFFARMKGGLTWQMPK